MNALTIRKAAVAGYFYPNNQSELRGMINDYLRKVNEVTIPGRLRALVEPHAGYVYSGPIAAYGYKLLSKYATEIEKIILIGPSHHTTFYGVCESGFEYWETPLGKVRIESIRDKLTTNDKRLIVVYQQAHKPEHCLEVQLPFLQSIMKKDFVIYPILCSNVNPLELADALTGIIDDKTVVIASSDLSHYLLYDQAVRIDKIANESVPALDIKRFEQFGDACGKTAILTVMHIAKKKTWKGKFLDYRNSGDTAGPKTQVVGYGCYAFYDK